MLPVLLVACQYASTALITPPKTEKEKEEENATAQVRNKDFTHLARPAVLNLHTDASMALVKDGEGKGEGECTRPGEQQWNAYPPCWSCHLSLQKRCQYGVQGAANN